MVLNLAAKKLFAQKGLFRSFTILCVTIISITSVPFTQALSVADYSSNGVYFYDGSYSACAVSGLVGENNIEKIYNYLLGKGLRPFQAGGVLGNIRVEGGFSATRHEEGKSWDIGGYGIVQWTGSRRDAIAEKIKEVDPSLMEYYKDEYGGAVTKENGYVHADLPVEISDRFMIIELDFLYQEATNRKVRSGLGFKGDTEWEAIQNSKTLREASDIWLKSFERPGNQSDSHAEVRQKYGEEALAEINVDPSDTSLSANTLSSSGPGCLSATGNVTALQQYVKAYAHPKYMGHGHITALPAYAQAIKKAIGEGMYVGGIKHKGIDCGGYVTRLIIDSGWDKSYNYSGLSKKGAGATPTQEKWLKANWEKLNITDTSQLQPGDVAMEPGHTWIFVGSIDGFDSTQSSASLDNRAPMASSTGEINKSLKSATTWYRKKGTSPAV